MSQNLFIPSLEKNPATVASSNQIFIHPHQRCIPPLDNYFYITTGFPIVGAWRAAPPIQQFFLKPPSYQNRCPTWGNPLVKNEPPPHLKNTPLQMKRESPFHEMIPRKSTININ